MKFLEGEKDEKEYEYIYQTILYGNLMNMSLIIMEGN